MKEELQCLLKKVSLDYQLNILRRLANGFDPESVDFLEDLKDILCNLYIFDSGEGNLIKNIVAYYNIEQLNRDDGLTWPFVQDILLLKILLEDHAENKQKILEFIVNYGDDKLLIEKRFERIKSGYLVKIAQDEYKKISKKNVNAHYYFGVSLMLKLIQKDIYKYYGKMDQLALDTEVRTLIAELQMILKDISSVSGD